MNLESRDSAREEISDGDWAVGVDGRAGAVVVPVVLGQGVFVAHVAVQVVGGTGSHPEEGANTTECSIIHVQGSVY